jgi:hypothetical protein
MAEALNVPGPWGVINSEREGSLKPDFGKKMKKKKSSVIRSTYGKEKRDNQGG